MHSFALPALDESWLQEGCTPSTPPISPLHIPRSPVPDDSEADAAQNGAEEDTLDLENFLQRQVVAREEMLKGQQFIAKDYSAEEMWSAKDRCRTKSLNTSEDTKAMKRPAYSAEEMRSAKDRCRTM